MTTRPPPMPCSRPVAATRGVRGRLAAAGLATGLAAAMLGVVPATASVADPTEGLLLHYPLTAVTGGVAEDVSGNDRDGTVVGGATADATEGLGLDGVDDRVELPDDLMRGLAAITVTVDVLVDPAQRAPFFIWGLGNTATSNAGTGYLFASGSAFRAGLTTTNWQGERVTAPTPARNLARGVWKSVTYTQTGTTGTLYEDGVQVAQNTGVDVLPGAIGNGTTTNNLLGDSSYAADNSLDGQLRDFRVYDRALSAAEVVEVALTDDERLVNDVAALDLGDVSAVVDDLALPTTGRWGSALAWNSSDPAVLSAAGVVTRPAPGDGSATVTLTATATRGGTSQATTFTVTVLPEPDDQVQADEAAAALQLVNAYDVRGHLTLPTAGLHGAQVSWTSTAPGVVATDGIVARPAPGAGDTTVTLTAAVTVGAVTVTRAFELTVRQLPQPAEYTGYAFSYFVDNSVAGEQIYFAASEGNDALQWQELNGGEPVLESTEGTLGLRDPFLIRSPEGDRFFLIATDLSIGRNGDWGDAQRNGSRYIEVWESTDLVNWSEQRHALVSPPSAGNTWAPEAFWDQENQEYVVFWASKLYADETRTGETYNRMIYVTTRDFVTFSDHKVWQDVGDSRIDSTVLLEDGVYHRFTKDEGAGQTGCSDIIHERSASLTAVDLEDDPSWEFVAGCIGRDAGTSAVEGPTVFEANPGDTSPYPYYLFVDEYGGRGYIPLGTEDLDEPDWTVPADFDLPASPRHGTVIPVTQAEHDTLVAALPEPEPDPGPDPLPTTEDGLVLHYPMDATSGTVVADASGNGNDATLVGGASWVDGSVRLDGVDDFVDLPDHLMAGMDQITVSTDVWIAADQATPYFVYGFGNTTGGAGDGYLFTTGNGYRTSITTGTWTGEQTVSSGSNLPRGAWHTLTYTLDGANTATLYLDGQQVGVNRDVTVDPGDIGDGYTTANYIGRSNYDSDRRLKGQVRDFSVYDRALSAAEVAAVASDGTGLLAVEADGLKVPAIISSADGTVVLPVVPGTDVTALDVTYTVAAGSSVSVTGPADYTDPVTVTVTAADGTTRDWTVSAVQMRSPVLPGRYADPNIAVFDGVYHIYATSDGYPGWGGQEFYVWSSTDLVGWTRSTEPILTLDGADGDVPWAVGNAWAPTIIERDGKFYFYFSGHNAALNRKTIGVAVADSPTGPFTAQPEAMITNGEDVRSGQAIDPAAFRDPETGKHYLFWGNGNPVFAELADDMVSLVPGSTRAMSGLQDYREGTFVVHRDGTYHLTYSIDDTGSENYRVGYATATDVEGPWTYRGVILEKDTSQGILGTGHNSIVNVPGTDEWYVVYHRFAIPGGNGTNRETTIDRLTFGEDGLIQDVVPTLGSIEPLERPPATDVSLADVLGEDTSGPETRRADGTDYDLLTWAVGRVLAADPSSPVSVLTDPTQPLTVFLPDDAAFVAGLDALLPGRVTNEAGAYARMRTTVSVDTLEAILLGHVVVGSTVTSSDVADLAGQSLTTAAGTTLVVRVGDDGSVTLESAAGVRLAGLDLADLDLNLGQVQVAHGVDAVLPAG